LQEDLSLAKFGVKIDENKSKIYNIESNRQKVPGYILQRIVVLFNVNSHWLLTGEGEMYQSTSENAVAKPAFSAGAPRLSQQNLIKNHRQAKITAFIEHWFTTQSVDEQVWFEVHLGHSFPQYSNFISNKEIEEKLRRKQAG
jgi:hypothetical protein